MHQGKLQFLATGPPVSHRDITDRTLPFVVLSSTRDELLEITTLQSYTDSLELMLNADNSVERLVATFGRAQPDWSYAVTLQLCTARGGRTYQTLSGVLYSYLTGACEVWCNNAIFVKYHQT